MSESGEQARARVRRIADRIAEFAERECDLDYNVVVFVRDRIMTPAISGHGFTEKFRMVRITYDAGILPVMGEEIRASIAHLNEHESL